MKVWQYAEYGNINSLELNELEHKGSLNPGWAEVQVHSISVNPLDFKIFAGEQKLLSNWFIPFTPGVDFSGTIHEIASTGSKKGFTQGQRVYGMVNPFSTGGTAKEYIRVPLKYCSPIPKNMSFEEAAALPAAGISAIAALEPWLAKTDLAMAVQSSWHSGEDKGKNSEWEIVKALAKKRFSKQDILVSGAAGGVGHILLQILNAFDANIHAISSDNKREFLSSYSLKNWYDYQKLSNQEILESLVETWKQNLKINQFTGIIDCAGSFEFDDYRYAYKLIKKKKDAQKFRVSRVSVANSKIFAALFFKLFSPYPFHFFLAQPGFYLQALSFLTKELNLKPRIIQHFPMAELAKALEMVGTGHQAGKIVLSW
jgi:NADPH:quinone reductase-like Zn-dependent oxidoreductase